MADNGWTRAGSPPRSPGDETRARTPSRSSEKKGLLARIKSISPAGRMGEGNDDIWHGLKQTVAQEYAAQTVRNIELRVIFAERITTFLGIAGLVLSILENELYYQEAYINRDDGTTSGFRFTIGLVVMITTVLTLAGVVYHHYLHNEMKTEILQKRKSIVEKTLLNQHIPSTVLLQTSRRTLIIELLVVGIVCPPGMDVVFQLDFLRTKAAYRLESFILLWMYARLYLPLRLWRDREALELEKSMAILSRSGVNLCTKFIAKRTLEEHPVPVLVTVLAFVLLFGSYALRVGEISLEMEPGEDNPHIYFWTNVWLVVTTITTVGFGDTSPKTHIGRAVCGVTMILSMVFVSLMTASLTKAIGYTSVENRVAHLVNRQRWRQDLLSAAARLIQLWWKDKRRRGCVDPSHFTVVRDLWQKAQRRHIRAIQTEATVEKGLDGVIDKVSVLMEAAKTQLMVCTRLDINVKHVSGELGHRFDSLETKMSSLRHNLGEIQGEMSSMVEMRRNVKVVAAALEKRKAQAQEQALETLAPNVVATDDAITTDA